MCKIYEYAYTYNIIMLEYKFQPIVIQKPTYNVKGEKLVEELVIPHEHGERMPVLALEWTARKHTYIERRGSAVVSTSAWHAVIRGSIPGPRKLYFR